MRVNGRRSVVEGLREGRVAVARALAIGATTGPEPDEETLSWQLQANAGWASELITVRRFTRHEENHYTGADWLWWWEGHDDEWFGCLVQAKRVKRTAAGLSFGYDYRPAPSTAIPDPPTQIGRLLDAADVLAVPAAYMLYRSPAFSYPSTWSCPTIEPGWETCAATFIAAAVVNEWLVFGTSPRFEVARPVECLACDGGCGSDMARLAWYAQRLADPKIREVLTSAPSTPARRAFRALFSEVVELRSSQLRAADPETTDRLHSGFELGSHFSRGLREPPWYVRAVRTGDAVEDLAGGLDQVAGVVVVSGH